MPFAAKPRYNVHRVLSVFRLSEFFCAFDDYCVRRNDDVVCVRFKNVFGFFRRKFLNENSRKRRMNSAFVHV